nr:helix-turn-helix transcriptional regulator [Streptomyces caniscabiei]
MTAKLDYRWHLREVMATNGMFSTTDLRPLLAERGIDLSASQIHRLVAEVPERLNLKVLMALLDILGCSMDDLIEPDAAGRPRAKVRLRDQYSVPSAADLPPPARRRRTLGDRPEAPERRLHRDQGPSRRTEGPALRPVPRENLPTDHGTRHPRRERRRPPPQQAPLGLPPPLDGWVLQLVDIANDHQHTVMSNDLNAPWLFPTQRPGKPLGSKQLSRRLRKIGLPTEAGRCATLLDLCPQMPPAVLQRLLGISPTAAERWAAGAVRTAYAAEVACRSDG